MPPMTVIRVLAWVESPWSLSERLRIACDQPCVVQVEDRQIVPVCPQVAFVLGALRQRRLGDRFLHPDTIVVNV